MIRFVHGLAVSLALVVSIPAHATYNATATGSVSVVQQMSTSLPYSPETVIFQLATGQPSACPGSGGTYFVISPNSMTDAQTRKNTLAMLLMARATGASIE